MSLSVAKRLGFVAVMAFAIGACSQQSSAAPPVQTAQVSAPSSPQPVGTLNGRALPDFATLVEQVGPAVVNVHVLEKAHKVRNNSSDDSASDDPFQEFFKRFGIPAPDQGNGGRREFQVPQRQGEGSGFIVSPDGYILTNEHVIGEAEQLWITTDDHKVYPAIVVGSDPRADLLRRAAR